MQDFSKRKTINHLRFGATVGATLLLVLLAFFAMRAAFSMYQKSAQAAAGEAAAKDELDTLQKQDVQTQSELDDMSSSRGREAQVRERYGVVKPGEGVIEIVRNSTSSEATNGKKEGFFSRLWHTIFPW